MSQATIMEAAINKKFSMNICLNNAFLSAPNTFRKLYTFPRFINQDSRSGDSRKYTFSLIPVSDLYWDQALIGRSGPDMLVSGNRSQLFILGGICLLVLLAGVMNFINLYLVLIIPPTGK